MRVIILVFASVLCLSGSVFAQEWGEYINRGDGVTHLAWAWQDLVEGHEIQLTNAAAPPGAGR